MNANNSKRLIAAFAVMALVVCCFAVTTLDETDAVSESAFTTEFETGTYTVDGAEEVTLTSPLTVDKATTINGTGTLTINYAATAVGQSMITLNDTLLITDGVNVVINMTSNIENKTANDGLHVFSGTSAITVNQKSSLTVSQAADAYGVTTSWGGNLVVDDATVDFNRANSASSLTVTLTNNAVLKFTNPNAAAAAGLKGTATNSTISVTGAGSSVFNVYGIELNNSTLTTDGDVGVYEGQTVTMTGATSSINADEIYSINAKANTTPTITGGKINADVVTSPTDSEAMALAGGVEVTGSVSSDVFSGTGGYKLNGTTVNAGETVYSGILDADENGVVTVPAGAKLIDVVVNPGVTMTLQGNAYTSYGTFRLYGTINTTVAESTITVDKDGSMTAYPGSEIKSGVYVTGEGKIDISSAMSTGTWSEDISSNIVWSQSQRVVIDGTMTIKAGWSLTVLGELVIDEGVTVIIEDGATLQIGATAAIGGTDAKAIGMTVNGTIEVEEGGNLIVVNAEDVAVSGTVTSSGIVDISSTVTVNNGGSIIIDDYDGSQITVDSGLTIEAGGEITVSGKMDITTITNKGTVILDGAEITKSSKISMAADGAVTDIQSFTGMTGNSLTVTDEDLEFADETTVTGDDVNRVVLVPRADNTGVGGIVLTEAVTSKTVDRQVVYSTHMTISGSAAFIDNRENIPDNDQTKNSINLAVNKIVLEAESTLNIGKNITMSLNKGTFDVDGTITATASGSQITYDADDEKVYDVSGLIQTVSPINDNINAFQYENDIENVPNYYYTNLTDAIASGAETIRAMGAPNVSESVTIPTGVTLRESSGTVNTVTDHITIGSMDNRDVTVTVADGATVRSSYIDVYGSLVFENNRKDNRSTNHIVSDVIIDAEPRRTYTNIYTALDVDSGTITIANGTTVYLDKDAEVKAGVTLVVPTNSALMLYNDVTLTVNGTLQNSGTVDNVKDKENGATGAAGFNPETDDHATIDVNGTFKNLVEQQYTKYYIAGAYYQLVNTEGSWYYITPVEQAAAVSNDVERGVIEIFGENTVTDVTFTGDADMPVTVTVTGELNAGTVTLLLAGIDVNGAFTGTIASAVGSVDAVNATGFEVVDTVVGEDEVQTTYLTGEPIAADTELDSSITVATGKINAGQIDTTVADASDFAIASGATLEVSDEYNGATATIDISKLTVDGTLRAVNGGEVFADTLVVRGTFEVAVDDDANDITAGSAQVTTLFVGIAQDEKTMKFVDVSAATVNAEAIDELDYIYVSAESTITDELIERMNSTEFYVEDALWMTAYVANGASALPISEDGSNNTVDYNLQPGDLENSVFVAWTDADGEPLEANVNVGNPDAERVYANLNYNIYTITVFADPGITAVYVDGKLMTSGVFRDEVDGMWAEGFQITVAAGTHEITYKLGTYFSGEAQMTVNGESVTGNSFTTSGTTSADRTVTIFLQGIEASTPETPSTGGSDDGMGLTDYLLIILVVLIVIMAIIVALRLMRS